MRKTDAAEGIMRSDLAWLTLAVNIVAEELKNGTNKESDVLSVVAMRNTANVVIECQPFDWTLYNKIVDFLRTSQPKGAGCYIPSLNVARELLNSNNYASFELQLTFLSDGRPSDELPPGTYLDHSTTMNKYAEEYMADIASHLGNRLTVGAIALGQPGCDNFSTLQTLADTAKEYGRGYFQQATLCPEALEGTLSRLSESVTATMNELTDDTCTRQRQVRMFQKETVKNIGGAILTDEWDFVPMEIYKSAGLPSRFHRTIVCTKWVANQGWTPLPRYLTFTSEKAGGVAFKKRWFGEGAERLVKEFREVDSDGVFVGPPIVAKDTKFIMDSITGKDFHKVFSKTQAKAAKIAEKFNKRLKQIPRIDMTAIPTIEFLDCSVYMIEVNGNREGFLVERLLDIKSFKYQKWNDNDGFVKNKQRKSLRKDAAFFPIKDKLSLCPIREEKIIDSDDSSESSGDETGEDENWKTDLSQSNNGLPKLAIPHAVTPQVDEIDGCDSDTSFSVDDIPQAFSCFSFWASSRKYLVCDLQGILNTNRDPLVFELFDPVIHHSSSNAKATKYGRTDKGWMGIHAFHETHTCSNLCRLLRKNRRFIRYENVVKLEAFVPYQGPTSFVGSKT